MRFRFLPLLAALLLLISGCGADSPTEADFFAMDTVMSVKTWGGGDDAPAAAQAEITRLEDLLSTTLSSSDLYKVNRDGGGTLSDETAALLARTLALSDRTGGALDPTLYPISLLWGFQTGNYRVPSDEEIAAALQSVGTEHVQLDGTALTLTDGAELDFGAVAKGYAAQKVIELLKARGCTAGVLSLGGNVQTFGQKPDGSAWTVAVQSPFDSDATIGSLTVGEKAVVTSGGYQRYFEQDGVRYIHILDPETGKPADSGLASVTIVADDGLLADALSTALFVMGREKATEFWRASDDFEMVLIDDDGTVWATDGLTFSTDHETIARQP